MNFYGAAYGVYKSTGKRQGGAGVWAWVKGLWDPARAPPAVPPQHAPKAASNHQLACLPPLRSGCVLHLLWRLGRLHRLDV